MLWVLLTLFVGALDGGLRSVSSERSRRDGAGLCYKYKAPSLLRDLPFLVTEHIFSVSFPTDYGCDELQLNRMLKPRQNSPR